MSISLNVSALEPLHYITAERVAKLRRLLENVSNVEQGREYELEWSHLPEDLRDAKVLLMALEQITST